MKNTTQNEQAQQPAGRLLGRLLARELSAEELATVAGGMKKRIDEDYPNGTGCEPWGNLDDSL